MFPIASSLPLPPRPLPLLLCFPSSSSSTSRAGRLSFRAAAKTVGNASIPLAEVLADRRLLRGRGYALKCAWKTLKTASKRKVGRLPSSSSSSPSLPPPPFLLRRSSGSSPSSPGPPAGFVSGSARVMPLNMPRDDLQIRSETFKKRFKEEPTWNSNSHVF